jgi:hypothetical protein
MNNTWLVFSSSLTARQQALRVKVWRRLAAIGAVPLKNSLWLLPARDDCREHLSWLAQEVEEGGGEAVVLSCVDLGGISEAEGRDLFRRARDADYAELEQEAAALTPRRGCAPAGDAKADGQRREGRAFLKRAERRLQALHEIDFFPSGRGEVTRLALDALAAVLLGCPEAEAPSCQSADYLGRTWVTREHPYIDRLASYWLVTRRIDPDGGPGGGPGAKIRFLAPDEPLPREPGVVSFDMPGADFTHRGGLVTFEVLAQDFGLRDAAVRRLTGIVKAIDLADDSGEGGGLPAEARAVKDVLDGLVAISSTDAELLERALVLFDALAATYSNTNTGE